MFGSSLEFLHKLTSSTHQVCVEVIFSAYIQNILVESASSQMCSFRSNPTEETTKKNAADALWHYELSCHHNE